MRYEDGIRSLTFFEKRKWKGVSVLCVTDSANEETTAQVSESTLVGSWKRRETGVEGRRQEEGDAKLKHFAPGYKVRTPAHYRLALKGKAHFFLGPRLKLIVLPIHPPQWRCLGPTIFFFFLI